MESIPAIVYEALQDMKIDFRAAHERIRNDLTQGVHAQMAAHQKLSDQLTQIQLTINTIQTERAMEKAEVVRRSALVSVLVGTGLTGLIKLAEWFKHP